MIGLYIEYFPGYPPVENWLIVYVEIRKRGDCVARKVKDSILQEPDPIIWVLNFSRLVWVMGKFSTKKLSPFGAFN